MIYWAPRVNTGARCAESKILNVRLLTNKQASARPNTVESKTRDVCNKMIRSWTIAFGIVPFLFSFIISLLVTHYHSSCRLSYLISMRWMIDCRLVFLSCFLLFTVWLCSCYVVNSLRSLRNTCSFVRYAAAANQICDHQICTLNFPIYLLRKRKLKELTTLTSPHVFNSLFVLEGLFQIVTKPNHLSP